MPTPWETAYADQWLAFVKAFGARYDANPALAYVVITGFMQTNGMSLADGQDEINLAANAI